MAYADGNIRASRACLNCDDAWRSRPERGDRAYFFKVPLRLG
jgi:hypothetical protein